jgi:hypothetical protein
MWRVYLFEFIVVLMISFIWVQLIENQRDKKE